MEWTNKVYFNGEELIRIDETGQEIESKYFYLAFSVDEKNHLNLILNKFGKVSAKRFERILEELCRVEHRILNSPDPTDSIIENDIADLLKGCKKTVKQLHKVSRGEQPLISFNKLNFRLKKDKYGMISPEHHNNADTEWWANTMEKATISRNALLDFIECFGQKPTQAKRKVGRSNADSSGFIKEIANAYNLCFNTPVTEYSGTFKGIVQFALEAVGSKHIIDPTRKIRDALSTP